MTCPRHYGRPVVLDDEDTTVVLGVVEDGGSCELASAEPLIPFQMMNLKTQPGEEMSKWTHMERGLLLE